MYHWKDIEEAGRHREDLLREAERIRLTNALRHNNRRRRVSLASGIRWELARGLGLVAKVMRQLPVRG